MERERLSAGVNRARAAERGLIVASINWIGIVIAFAFVLTPIASIYWLLIVPLIPIMAMLAVARSKGRLKLLSDKKQRNGVDLLVLLVPMFMVLRAMRDFDLIDWKRALLLAALVGVAYSVLAYMAFRLAREPRTRGKSSKITWIFITCIGAAYGWGLNAEINGVKAFRSTEIYRAKIQDKWVTSGKYRTPTLLLASQNTALNTDQYRVGKTLYERINKGDQVCINVHTGLLSLRWYVITDC
jgi:hypothetical protein